MTRSLKTCRWFSVCVFVGFMLAVPLAGNAVIITFPHAGSVLSPGNYDLTWLRQPSDGTTSVVFLENRTTGEVLINNQGVGSAQTIPADLNTPGLYFFRVATFAFATLTDTKEICFHVDDEGPTIQITSPAPGCGTEGVVAVVADIEDLLSGIDDTVSGRPRLLIDGSPSGIAPTLTNRQEITVCPSSDEPFTILESGTFTWQVPVGPGGAELTVAAADRGGNESIQGIVVSVCTPTPTETNTPTPSYTFTVTPTFTSTPVPTETPTSTETATPVPTDSPTPSETSTPTSSPTVTDTATVTPTATSTSTPKPTATANATLDLSGNGVINSEDLQIFSTFWHATGPSGNGKAVSNPGGEAPDLGDMTVSTVVWKAITGPFPDVVQDGVINAKDLLILIQDMGKTVSAR